MTNGILLIDKPAGISSASAIARVKRRLSLGKIGHAGTLDPMATGLLVCVTGSATRLAGYAEAGIKSYTGELKLGLTTDSDDITGKVISISSHIPPLSLVIESSRKLIGRINQVPPAYSAIKVAGERAYHMARQGEKVALAPRQVEIFDFDLQQSGTDTFLFSVCCSKGTYVRALARDLGAMLDCGATLTALRRTASFPFTVGHAKDPEQVSIADLLGWQELFPSACHIMVERDEARRLCSGDVHALTRVTNSHSHAHSLAGSLCADLLVYKSHSEGAPLGLLVRRGDSWNFAVNVSGGI